MGVHIEQFCFIYAFEQMISDRRFSSVAQDQGVGEAVHLPISYVLTHVIIRHAFPITWQAVSRFKLQSTSNAGLRYICRADSEFQL